MADAAGSWEQLKRRFEQLSEMAPQERKIHLDAIRDKTPELAEELVQLLSENDADSPLALEQWLDQDERPHNVEGQRIGAYRLVEQLGQGGMGQVFLAQRVDGQFEQRVALKLIRGAMDGPDNRARFLAERQILARLEHANIARLLDGGLTDQGSPYIVMEWVQGRSLTDYCDEERVGLDGRIDLFLQICRAVQAAHRRLVVHRDLKPSNILVTDEGVVKLLDFGIAKLLDTDPGSEAPLTRTGLYVLTPEYASPEQVNGEDIGTASDVYALGLLLYELLTGIKGQPVASTSPVSVARSICVEHPLPPSRAVQQGEPESTSRRANLRGGITPTRLARRLRGDLDTIIRMAIRKEPDRRYLSVEDLGDDLLCYRTSRPVRARKDTLTYHVSKFVRRHRIAVAAGVVTVAALAGGLALSLTSLRHARQAERHAVAEAESAQELADFLVGLFGATDPEAVPGAEVSARSMLDRGARDVQSSLGSRPDLQSDLLLAIGRAYFQMGLGEDASPLLEEAARLRESLGDPAGSADALVYVAFNDLRRGATEDGIDAARRAVGQLEAAAEENPEALAAAYSLLGQTLYGARRIEAAIPELERALRLQRSLKNPNNLQIAEDLDQLGNAVFSTGDDDRGLELLAEAIAIIEDNGADPAAMANGLTRLGLLFVVAEKLDQAEETLDRAGIMAQEAAGDGHHPEVADAALAAATLAGARDDLDATISSLRRAEVETEIIWGPDHYKMAMVQLRLGKALLEAGQPDQALQELAQGRATLEATARGHTAHLQAFDQPMAQALEDLGRTQEALELAQTLSGSSNPRRAETARAMVERLKAD